MAYFTHRFETSITRHAVGTYHYTVVYLPDTIARTLPFAQHPRLRVEADVGGVPVKGAWQPAKGVWYLMLPKAGLRHAARPRALRGIGQAGRDAAEAARGRARRT